MDEMVRTHNNKDMSKGKNNIKSGVIDKFLSHGRKRVAANETVSKHLFKSGMSEAEINDYLQMIDEK